MKNKITGIAVLAMALGLLPLAYQNLRAGNEVRNIQVVAVEVAGTKFWLPSTILAKKGDTVKIHAVSKVPGKNNIHGFAIDEFKVEALVDDKGKDIEFVANKAGIFPIRCHLHPTHIGGQILVTD